MGREVLTERQRCASPPNVNERPRMSLKAQRDDHDILDIPILRQALTLIAPEYDQLAQGPMLQYFPLTSGIGRFIANPVRCAISV